MADTPMIRAKPPGYFGREVSEDRLKRFIEYGLPAEPEVAAAFTEWSVRAGTTDGVIIVTIDALPAPMDGEYYGDGAGVLSNIGWAYGEATGLLNTIGTGEFTIDAGTWHADSVALYAVTQVGAGTSASLPFEAIASIWPATGIWPTTGVWPAA